MNLTVTKHSEFELAPLGESERAMDVLREAAAILGDRMWVGCGTLLGIHRDDRLIPWDTDIDFMCVANPERFSCPRLPEPFRLIRTMDWGHLPMQRAYTKDGVIVDLAFFWTGFDDGLAHLVDDCGRIRMDPAIAEPSVPMEWNGITLRTPPDRAKWLEWWYGPTWTQPRGYKSAAYRDSVCRERGWTG